MMARQRITSNNWIDARAKPERRRVMKKSSTSYATMTCGDGEAENYF